MAGHFQDRGNGSYLLVYHVGYDANGKRIRKTRTVKCKNNSEARIKLAKFVTEITTGEYVAPSNTKLKTYAEKQYIKSIERNLAPSTVELYQSLLNNYTYQHLGHYPLEKITHSHIGEYIQVLEDLNFSSSTIQKHHNLLNGLFKLAVRNEVITANPMDKVDKVSVTHEEGDIYDNNEINALINLLNKEDNTQMSLLVKLAVTTGMRRGEILALQWDDVDFNSNTINVRHSLSYTKDHGYQIRQPKTDKSIRTISVSNKLMNELKKHKLIKSTERLEASELWEGGKRFFVFSSTFGKPLYPSVPSRYFRRFLDRTGFKKIRFHDLRHTHVNYLIGKGASIADVSKRLGHSSIAITVDVYGHLDRERDEALANMFDDIL